MSVVASIRRPLATVYTMVRRPSGIVGSTRWLMAVLALFTALNGVPAVFNTSHGVFLIVALLSIGVLVATTGLIYFGRRVPFVDLVDAAALFGVVMALNEAGATFMYMFAAVWFRGFYGPSLQRLLRPAFYGIALVAALALWPLNPIHVTAPNIEPVVGFLPVLLVTAVIAGRLGAGLLAQEQALSRDATLAAAGAELLALRDGATIRSVSWQAMTELCAASPGMRMLKAERVGTDLVVTDAVGAFARVPVSLPGRTIITAGAGAGAVLDAPAASMLAMTSLLNQTLLALRNADVHSELTVQARIDALTGLANRAAFTRELATLLFRRDGATEVHVLFLDLDDFKNVNDLLGHRAGDELLIAVSLRLRSCIRPGDLCARLGGDEFAVVLATASDAEAEAIAQRIVDSIGEPVDLGGSIAQVGVSVGIACSTPGIGIDDFVHQADVAMYAAKAQGKGRIALFHGELLQADTSRVSLERQIAAATAAGEIVVHYQPVLALPGLQCTAVEAFLRWQHPTRGLLLPAEFIDAADRVGAIIDIGTFALHQACADAVRWREDAPALELHISVSARQLLTEGFVSSVEQCLEQAGLPADALVLELTETLLINSPTGVQRLSALVQLGVHIAVGEFGTGYSSFVTLRSLPLDVIKLDAGFVAAAAIDTVDRSVLTAVVELSTNELGLRVIADGVERPEQQQFLAEIGTNAVQGSMYLRPVPAVEFNGWLQCHDAKQPRAERVVSALRSRRTASVPNSGSDELERSKHAIA